MKMNKSQHSILKHFLVHKQGLCIEDLASLLLISRTAVQQHFNVLENCGYLTKKTYTKTAGRPITRYAITDKGIHYFPKQYAWFAALVLEDLFEILCEEEIEKYMTTLGQKLAIQLSDQFQDKSLNERIAQLLLIMNKLGYDILAVDLEDNVKLLDDKVVHQPLLRAHNCVYHELAQKHTQICEFDLAFMSTTLGEQVSQSRCMAKGDRVCEFSIIATPSIDEYS